MDVFGAYKSGISGRPLSATMRLLGVTVAVTVVALVLAAPSSNSPQEAAPAPKEQDSSSNKSEPQPQTQTDSSKSEPQTDSPKSEPQTDSSKSEPQTGSSKSEPERDSSKSEPEKDSSKSEPEGRVFYNGTQVWRVNAAQDTDFIGELKQVPDVTVWWSNTTSVDLLVKQDKVADVQSLLKKRGLSYLVSIPDLQSAIDEENPRLTDEELDELTGRKGHRMTWQHYHRAQDMMGFLDYLAQTYPDKCSVQTIGSSVEGRPLKVLNIRGKPGSPSMWVDGGIHAREWITSASVSYLINELVENRASYESWLSKVNLYILPLANPDGYEHTHIGDRLWRKNRRSNGGYATCAGTDLNRNWGYKWGGEGASAQPCRETYRGSGPFSEPETNAIQRYILQLRDLKGYLTFHSYGQYILYPWGYGRFVPPDHADLHRVGQKIATAMKAASGLQYTVGASGATLYPASGGSDDWAKGTANIKYPYTVELRDTGRHGFVLPASYIKSSGKEALSAVEALANEIGSPYASTTTTE